MLLHEIEAAIHQNPGSVIVTGMPGSGKSALCRALADHAGGNTFTARIGDRIFSEEQLLAGILQDFGLISKDSHWPSKEDMTEALDRFLRGLPSIKASAALIVDDADRVPLSALLQVDRLTRAEAKGRPLLQAVLVGAPDLSELLQLPELVGLDGRIAARHELEVEDAAATPGGPWLQRPVSPLVAAVTVLLASVLAVAVTTLVYQRLGF